MYPAGGRRRLEAAHPLRQQPCRQPGQHIARTCRRQPGRRIAVDRGPAIGRGDHAVRALQDHHRPALRGGSPRPLQLAAGQRREQPCELPLMRCQHHRPLMPSHQARQMIRLSGRGRQRVGIKHQRLAGLQRRARHAARVCPRTRPRAQGLHLRPRRQPPEGLRVTLGQHHRRHLRGLHPQRRLIPHQRHRARTRPQSGLRRQPRRTCPELRA